MGIACQYRDKRTAWTRRMRKQLGTKSLYKRDRACGDPKVLAATCACLDQDSVWRIGGGGDDGNASSDEEEEQQRGVDTAFSKDFEKYEQ